jgi:hypothetical protein
MFDNLQNHKSYVNFYSQEIIDFMIKFKEYGYERASNNTQKLRELFDKVIKKRLQKPQLERIQQELLEGGYPNVDVLTLKDINEYVFYKRVYPRTRISKKNLELSLADLNDHPENSLISAEDIYKRVIGSKESILGEDYEALPDSTFYYWFNRLQIKFSKKGYYSKHVASMIYYAAYSYEKSKIYPRDKDGKFTTI